MFFRFLYKIKILCLLLNLLDVYILFLFILKYCYDLVNVYFWNRNFFFLYLFYRIISFKLMIFLWGSDVYCINVFDKLIVKLCYYKVDYIFVVFIKFWDDIVMLFNVLDGKFVNLGFGFDIIDVINV